MGNLAVDQSYRRNLTSNDDPYRLRAGSLVLANKLGIEDAVALKDAELVLSMARRVQSVPTGSYDFEHYKAIHAHLFQDIYEWAGETRTVEMTSPTNSAFCAVSKIETEAKRIFDNLAESCTLIGLDEDEFTKEAARLYTSLNRLHPFRTGNGRVARVFIEELARNNGLTFNWKRLNRADWNFASAEANKGNLEHITGLFKTASCKSELVFSAGSAGVRPPSKSHLNKMMDKLIQRNKEQLRAGRRMEGAAEDDFGSQSKKSSFSPS